jgi:hypothetical protein
MAYWALWFFLFSKKETEIVGWHFRFLHEFQTLHRGCLAYVFQVTDAPLWISRLEALVKISDSIVARHR